MTDEYKILKLKAIKDKETKNTYRFSIESKKGISGIIYLNKNEYEDAPKTILVKVRVPC